MAGHYADLSPREYRDYVAPMRHAIYPLSGVAQQPLHRRFVSSPEFSSAAVASSVSGLQASGHAIWQLPTYLAPALGEFRPPEVLRRQAPSALSAVFDGLQSGSSASAVPTSAQRAPPPMLRANTTPQEVALRRSELRSPLLHTLPDALPEVNLEPLTKQPVTYFNYTLKKEEPGAPVKLSIAPIVPARNMRKTEENRPFRCDECTQSFLRGHDLKRHKKIHLTIKPYPCGWCDKTFSRRDALKRHLLVKTCGEGQGQTQEWSERGISRAPSLMARSIDAPLSATSSSGFSAEGPDSPASFDDSRSAAASPAALSDAASEVSLSPELRHSALASPIIKREPSPEMRRMRPSLLVTSQASMGLSLFTAKAEPVSPVLSPVSERSSLADELAQELDEIRRNKMLQTSSPGSFFKAVARQSPIRPAFTARSSYTSFADSEASTPSSASLSDKSSAFFSTAYPTLNYSYSPMRSPAVLSPVLLDEDMDGA